MILIAPLWAAGAGDIVTIILVILFVVVPAIGQLFGKKEQPRKGPAGRGAGPQPAPKPAPGNVEDEIGEFLRRVVQKREAARPQAAQPARPRPQKRPPPPRPERAVQAEVVAEPVVIGAGRDLTSDQLPHRDFELAENISRVEKELEQHTHEKFDRQVGRISSASAPPAAAKASGREEPRPAVSMPSTAAAGLAAMLGDAQSLRQAILLNEIIQRPEHRW